MGRIGERIKEARIKANIPVKQLAKKCGVSESYIAEVESGRRVINNSMIKRISSILNANIDEPLYRDEEVEQEQQEVRQRVQPKSQDKREAAPQWQSAFSNIIKDIPIYKLDMSETAGYKQLPVIDKKVEGHNPEKLMYIMMPDNTLSGFRIKKGDIVMVVQNHEVLNNGLCFIEYEGRKFIRLVKRLDGERILLLSNPDEVRAETMYVKEVKILGHCIKAEIDLLNR